MAVCLLHNLHVRERESERERERERERGERLVKSRSAHVLHLPYTQPFRKSKDNQTAQEGLAINQSYIYCSVLMFQSQLLFICTQMRIASGHGYTQT